MARLREFDIDEALDGVMDVFWRNGYEGASMQAIEAATGLNKQSLYRVFEDKRAMYLAALARYEQEEMVKAQAVLTGEGSARQRFQIIFNGLVSLAAKGDRSGCFLCNAATDQAQLDAPTQEFVAGAMRRIEKLFRTALSVSEPYSSDEKLRDARAASLLAVYFGIRVLTKANAPLRAIRAASEDALASI
ncbi:MAG: helix-turn-helix domain-containing protein [Pseudomonadota bacterium]